MTSTEAPDKKALTDLLNFLRTQGGSAAEKATGRITLRTTRKLVSALFSESHHRISKEPTPQKSQATLREEFEKLSHKMYYSLHWEHQEEPWNPPLNEMLRDDTPHSLPDWDTLLQMMETGRQNRIATLPAQPPQVRSQKPHQTGWFHGKCHRLDSLGLPGRPWPRRLRRHHSIRTRPPLSKNNGRRKTTRHRMEMYAAIRALTTLEKPHNVDIKTTDVQLVHAVGARDFRKGEDLAEHLLPLLEIHNVVVTMNKDKNTPEYQETYARALRASRSNPPNPDTGYEKQQAAISQQHE